MTDLLSPNGGAKAGANITGTPDFVTVYSLIDHTPGDFGLTLTDTRNTFQFINSVMQLANPKYLTFATTVVDLSVSANRTFYGFGTNFNQAATNVYTVKFVVEQTGFVTAANLTSRLNTLAVPFTTTAVPITGPSTVDISAYDMTVSSTKNTTILVNANF